MDAALGWIILVVLYFVPSFVAWRRHHHNTASIFVLNLFLGFTVIGWVVCLVWAFSSRPREAAA